MGLVLFSDLNKCKEHIDPKTTGFWDRAYVRFFFSMVEGIAHRMRQVLITSHEQGFTKLAPNELALLREERYELNDRGKIRTRTAFANFLPSIQFTLRLFSRTYGLEPVFDSAKQHAGWTAFRKAVAIRNRLTHPKDARELIVTGSECKVVELADAWFQSLFMRLFEVSSAEIDLFADQQSKTILVGIDGCTAGWLAVSRSSEDQAIHSKVFSHFSDVISNFPVQALITVDIPIGLADSGDRECDYQARSILGKPRSSSVFSAPARKAAQTQTRDEANKVSQEHGGKKVSAQLWGIMPKIKEVDEVLQEDIGLQQRIREVHPELIFCEWNNGTPFTESKKSTSGFHDRKELVSAHFGENAFDTVRAAFTKGQVANDDICDAFAALWTAERIAVGQAKVIPDSPTLDDTGLRMEMWY